MQQEGKPMCLLELEPFRWWQCAHEENSVTKLAKAVHKHSKIRLL